MGGLKQSLPSVGEQMLLVLVLVLYPRVSSCHASLHPAKGEEASASVLMTGGKVG